jgi:NAD(P)-dependent dehydrogenase (short-subunit alcohol dehydrogenase family)
MSGSNPRNRIIVTGSCGLIGSRVTRYFKAKKGCDVLELDLALGHDLTDEGFVRSWFEKNPADYLVNLFALNDHVDSAAKRSTLFTVSLDSFRKFMEVNVVALFSVCREFARQKTAKGIVNFSSTYGMVSPLPSLYRGGQKHIGYSASKGAVAQLTRHLATHLAPRVRVNCIVPGGVQHQQGDEFIERYAEHTPLQRMMRGHELNGLLEYLCSEKSSYMTGSVITVDGGWLAW